MTENPDPGPKTDDEPTPLPAPEPAPELEHPSPPIDEPSTEDNITHVVVTEPPVAQGE